MMTDSELASIEVRHRHEQMLKLVTKGFYNELITYGVNREEVLTVAAHLLDNFMQNDGPAGKEIDFYNQVFTLKNIRDEWRSSRRLIIDSVSLTPLELGLIPLVRSWLQDPVIRSNFYPPFPEQQSELGRYFGDRTRQYFAIRHNDEPIGVIGAENIDCSCRKLEMRKFVGSSGLRSKGIGKRATFLFLYYVFVIMEFNKVYLFSLDTNIRNLNLNSKFGFELEGVFFEEVATGNKKQDLLRMALRAPVWFSLFR